MCRYPVWQMKLWMTRTTTFRREKNIRWGNYFLEFLYLMPWRCSSKLHFIPLNCKLSFIFWFCDSEMNEVLSVETLALRNLTLFLCNLLIYRVSNKPVFTLFFLFSQVLEQVQRNFWPFFNRPGNLLLAQEFWNLI